MNDSEELYKKLLAVSEFHRIEWEDKSDGINCARCSKPSRIHSWNMCATCYRYERRRTLKRAVAQAMGDACTQCDKTYPYICYDFHHVDTKTDCPTAMFAFNSLKKIADELSTCMLVCANCHRLLHEDMKDGA